MEHTRLLKLLQVRSPSHFLPPLLLAPWLLLPVLLLPFSYLPPFLDPLPLAAQFMWRRVDHSLLPSESPRTLRWTLERHLHRNLHTLRSCSPLTTLRHTLQLF